MNRFILLIAALSLTACATSMPDTSIDELANARAAIAAAKEAGAEKCAPKLQAQAVAALYAAAHEFSETDYHPDENASLAARAESKAKEAREQGMKNCQPKEIIKLNGVRFPHDSAEIIPSDIPILDKAVATLKRRSDINVEVAGHTDSSGSDAYNQALSARRAESVKNYLQSHGISASRLTSKGYGESAPIASNATKEGRAQNRRVELRVYD